MVLIRVGRFSVFVYIFCFCLLYTTQLHAETYTFYTKWGTSGTLDGQFDAPWGVAVNVDSNVYVVDSNNNRVQKFTSDGTFLIKWGSLGTTNGQLNWPRGIAVDPTQNAVYVTDNTNRRVVKFNTDGTYITQWGGEGTGNGQFSWPVGIAVDGDGNVYVVDNTRVQKFSSDGTYMTQWGSQGSGYGQFNSPHGIAVDKSKNIYVADSGNNRIQKFSSTGEFLAQIGEAGSGDGQLSGPRGVAVDASWNVYVTDTLNNRIQKFVPGTSGPHYVFSAKWGSLGSENGQFSNPRGIAVDGSGAVYVADEGNNRIQKFTLDTTSVSVGDSSGIISMGCNATVCAAIGATVTSSGGTTSYTTKIYTSEDLTSWTEKYTLSGAYTGGISFLGDNVVAFLYSYDSTAVKTSVRMVRSPDNGNTWSETYGENLTGTGGGTLQVLNNTFVAAFGAYDSTSKTTTVNIRFSTDGHGWVSKKRETLPGQGGVYVTYGNNTYVASLAAYDNATNTTTLKIFTSTDNGSTWIEKSLPTNTLTGSGGINVIYGNNVFIAYTSVLNVIAAGTSSTTKIFTSTDNGNTWSETYTQSLSTSGGFSGMTFGNNTFACLAYAYDPTANAYTIKTLTSTNGAAWTATTQNSLALPSQILFLNNIFVLSQDIRTCKNNICINTGTDVFLSNDGITWEKKYTDIYTFRVNYGLGTYVAYGTKDGRGTIKKISLTGGGGGSTQYTLTVNKSGTGSGGVSTTGLSCSGITCIGNYDAGTQITLTASADAGSIFAGWSGSGCSGTGTCIVTMDAAKSVTATFNIASTAQYSITVTVKDLADESVIQGATITIKDETLNMVATRETDSTGVITINILNSGFYSVKVSKSGYTTEVPPQLVEVNDALRTVTLTMYLLQEGTKMTQLSLVRGWNFISFPKQPSNTDIAVVLADMSASVRVVWGFDNQAQDWLIYRPTVSLGNSLSSLESGKGYWIYMNDGATINMESWITANTTVHLYENWNLVGYAGKTSEISSSFSAFSTKWDIVWTWIDGIWSAKHSTLALPMVTPMTGFTQGLAYWIKMKQGQAADWSQ